MAKQNKPPEYPSETGRFLSGHWSPLLFINILIYH